MTKEIGTSALLDTWASDGAKSPAPDLSKITQGWLLGERPPHEFMNWIQNEFGQKINHMLSRGAPDWNAETEFPAGAVVRHSGAIWIATATNANSEPASANTNWSLALGGRGNLSGLANTATARTNLGATALGSTLFTIGSAAAGRTALGLGTAATADVMTSPTDTTPERALVMRNGNRGPFGLGGIAPNIISSVSALPFRAEIGARYINDSATDAGGVSWPVFLTMARSETRGAALALNTISSDEPDAAIASLRDDGGSSWRRLYHEGNIVGTVSVDGSDVPNGAVVERDSNSDGQWTRFADGLQIMTRKADVDLTDSGEQLFDFPITAGAPGEVYTALGWAGSPGSTLSGDGNAASRAYVSSRISAQAWQVRCDGTGDNTRGARLQAISYWY